VIEHLAALLIRAPVPDGTGAPASGAGLTAEAVIRAGRVEAPLLGGSLTLLAALCGTSFLPSFEGAILVLEDVDEKPYRLDRYLTQLQLSGALRGLSGVAIGQFTNCDGQGIRGVEVLREWALSLGVPAVEGLSFGHDDANFAVPLGAHGTLIAPAPGDPGPPRLLFNGWSDKATMVVV
jgi:muramoyltetrapeptide carboxypeptidase